MKLTRLDGEKLYYAFISGVNKVKEKQKSLNKMNVFPVPDGDTGTNLASTLHAMIEGVPKHKNIHKVSEQMADAAISGSRGNSGIIFAQFVQGMSDAIRGKEYLNPKEFAHAVREGVASAYTAMSKPVEGTILTVMHAWSNALQKMHEKSSDFNEYIHHSIEAANESLKDTPNKLKALKQAGVVDAGAQGFVHFIEGMASFLKNHIKPVIDMDFLNSVEKVDDHTGVADGNIPFRYCTEMLVEGNDLKSEAIKTLLAEEGDSLIVAGSARKMHVHIHTNQPDHVLAKVTSLGIASRQKVEDMKRQYEIQYERKSSIAIVTDSTCDIPQHLIDHYQIHVVPLQIGFDQQTFLDRFTLSSKEFYKRLTTDSHFPKTSQPTQKIFQMLYQQLSQHYDAVISVHLSSGLSGTVEMARVAASKLENARISVIDSGEISLSLGLIVQQAAELALNGKSYSEILTELNIIMKKAQVFLGVKTMDYLIRGGRVSPFKGLLGRLLHIKPILTLDETGKARNLAASIGFKKSLKTIYKFMKKRHQQEPITAFAVGSVDNDEAASWLEEKVKALIGKDAVFHVDVTPVIGAHVGPGGVGVAII